MEPPDDLPQGFVYMATKAARFLEKGADEYRKGDALGMPPETMSEHQVQDLTRAMDQIRNFRGYRKDIPLENIPIATQHDLAATLHFRILRQQIVQHHNNCFLDKLTLQHPVFRYTLELFALSGD